MQSTPSVLLTIGECMVEMAPTAVGTFSRSFAGDSFNTAWYARKMLPADWDVSYYTCVGQDGVSQNMLDFIEQSGVGISSIRKLSDRTVGLYMIELKDGERSFSYWRSNSAARKLAADREALESAVRGVNAILFSGISIAILSDPDRQQFLEVMAQARSTGTRIAFDPNLRKRLWKDDDEMRAVVTKAAKCADIILPSFDEEQEFFGDTTPEDTIARYRDLGASTVVVKNGAEEMVAWSKSEGTQRAKPPVIGNPVDTTAAGDSFNAGALSAIITGQPLLSAISQGANLASKVVQGRGALVEIEPVE